MKYFFRPGISLESRVFEPQRTRTQSADNDLIDQRTAGGKDKLFTLLAAVRRTGGAVMIVECGLLRRAHGR